MRLLLTSSGLTNQKLVNTFIDLLGKPVQHTSVGFITTASNVENDTSYLEKDMDNLLLTGVSNVQSIDFANESIEEVKSRLDLCDVIWVDGGNTFYLLDQFRKTGFAKDLKNICENKLYVGVSAGSVIVTPNVKIACVEPADENTVGIEDFSGLNWVDFEVSPHSPELVSYKKVKEYQLQNKCKIYTIDEKSALKIVNNKVEAVGIGKVKLFE